MNPSAEIENSHQVDPPMDFQHAANALERLVVQQHRSLLQYADLCRPWMDLQESTERELLKNLAARQREGLRELVRELDRRNRPVDYGQFPTQYADLNFLSVDRLWPKLVHTEQMLLTELCRVRQAVDREAARVVDLCIRNQSEILQVISSHHPG